MEKFQDKYRIPSARAAWWDYSTANAYFITICTKNRRPFFGHIRKGVMCLNAVGSIAHNAWLRTLALRKDMNVELGEFIIMPNHFHAVVVIGRNAYNQESHNQEGIGVPPLPTAGVGGTFGPQRNNLPAIVRGFKSAVTKEARTWNIEFAWQSRYHDHIIRNERSFTTISNYIVHNPDNWQQDKFHTVETH